MADNSEHMNVAAAQEQPLQEQQSPTTPQHQIDSPAQSEQSIQDQLERQANEKYAASEVKRNYKLLKKAFKEEREFRMSLENELMTKIVSHQEQAIQIEELKDKNLELYESNQRLEENQVTQRHANKINVNPRNTDQEHIKEMLGTQNLLREEMKEKEFFKEQVASQMNKLIELQNRFNSREKELESEAHRRVQEVQLLEEKIPAMLEQITTLTKQNEEKDTRILSLKDAMRKQSNEIEEMQMKLLNVKSQVIEKDSQLSDLMENMVKKGEETAALSSQYLEMKNFVIDLQLFQTKYKVTRVPIAEIVQSPNVRAAMSTPETQQRKKKANVQRKDLIFSFVQDKEKHGEFFVCVQNPSEQTNSETGFADKVQPEKKLIPALDIKLLESVDSLTFSIILHDDCLLNCYDIVEQNINQRRASNRTSSLMGQFGKLLSNASGQQSQDGGFPMAFESDHVPDIIQGFQKFKSTAMLKQQELNARYEQQQNQQAFSMGEAFGEESKD